MLEHFGVTEENWQDATKIDPHFIESETPFYVGRAIAALAADPRVTERTGQALSSWGLSREYDFEDADGRRPDFARYLTGVIAESLEALAAAGAIPEPEAAAADRAAALSAVEEAVRAEFASRKLAQLLVFASGSFYEDVLELGSDPSAEATTAVATRHLSLG